MFSFFDADVSSQMGSPQDWQDIVVTSLIFAFFGIIMYIGSVRYELSYDKAAKWWWSCFAPLGIAVLLGAQRMAFLTNYAYINTVVTRKLMISHWASILVPVLCIAIILLHRRKIRQSESRRVY